MEGEAVAAELYDGALKAVMARLKAEPALKVASP